MNISCWRKSLILNTPFISNRGSTTTVEQLFFAIEWKSYQGNGCSLIPNEYVSSLSLEFIEKECNQILEKKEPFEIERIMLAIRGTHAIPEFINIAVEMALFDLLGQIIGLPLYKIWGLDQLKITQTSISISSLPLPQLLNQVNIYKEWPILKFKITSFSELNQIEKIRRIYKGRIWIDGNGSLNLSEALEACKILEFYQVELFEQPVPKGEIINLAKLRMSHEIKSIKLVADEDCVDVQDIIRLANYVDVVNIKLIKCGSLRSALTMINVAKNLGLQVMLGCKTESSLGVTAMAHLSGLADYVDFDGHIDINNDLFEGIVIKKGNFSLPEHPGIGIKALKDLTQ